MQQLPDDMIPNSLRSPAQPTGMQPAGLQSPVPPVEPPKSGVNKIALAILVLVFIAAGAFAAYKYWFNPKSNGENLEQPSVKDMEAWNKFLESPLPNIYSSKLSFEVEGKSADDNPSNPVIYNYKEALSAQSYLNFENSNTTTQVQMETKGHVDPAVDSLSDITFTENFVTINGEFFERMETDLKNPQVDRIGGKWVKDERADTSSAGSLPAMLDPLNLNNDKNISFDKSKIAERLIQTWIKSKYASQPSFVGKEEIGGQPTSHYKFVFNKEAFKQFKISTGEGKDMAGDPRADIYNEILSKEVDNINLNSYDVWVNLKTYQLAQMKIEGAFPSEEILLQQSYNKLTAWADTQRIDDLNRINNQLAECSKLLGGYPGSSGGAPAGDGCFKNGYPKPPAVSGVCSDYYGASYWYEPVGNFKTVKGKKLFDSYEVTFCLGEGFKNPYVDYKAGVGKMVPGKSEGVFDIQTGIPCPGLSEQCTGSGKPKITIDEIAKDPANQTKFKLNFEISDVGKVKDVSKPAEFIDLSTEEKNAEFIKQNNK